MPLDRMLDTATARDMQPPMRVEGTGTRADRLAVRRLTVTDFRNHRASRIESDNSILVLVGPNGAGKTNLLEAVSFLAPGRGMRRAKLSDVGRLNTEGQLDWAISARLDTPTGEISIGTGRDPAREAKDGERRITRIDGAPVKSQSELAEHVAISWLTPQMDRLFTEGSSNRRRFLDRLIYAFDAPHSTRVNAYTHALRERARLIRQGRRDDAWYAALEDTIATKGVAIAAARRDMADRLNRALAADAGARPSAFPGAELRAQGEVEDKLDTAPALAIEDEMRATLAERRRAEGGEPVSVPGPHRGDLTVRHVAKGMPAETCSTGEQKALLIAIVLAHARLRAADRGVAPILLLDEVAAHLDAERRAALYETLGELSGQVWLTGTDSALFEPLRGQADFHAIADGNAQPL